MTEPIPKSRLPHTGVILLVGVMLLLGGGALMVWLPHLRKQQAIAEIERLGGTTQLKVVPLAHSSWMQAWRINNEDERVWEVDLHGTQVGDAGLAPLSLLPHVEQLLLDNTQVGNVGLGNLRGLSKLKNLSLDSTQVGDAGMVHLSELTNLWQLGLYKTQVGDAGLEQFKGLTKLENLFLDETQVSDAGLEHLSGLRLNLNNTKVSDNGLEIYISEDS